MFTRSEPHFEELRGRLLISFWAVLFVSIGCYFYSRQLLDCLTQPLREQPFHVELFFQQPYEAFLVHIKTACLFGIIFSSPILFAQTWLFLAPGLYAREKKRALFLIGSSTGLFLAGVFFAFKWVIPWGLGFLLSYQTENMKPLLGVGPYYSFIFSTLFAFGILFDLPVVIIGLVQLGIVETKTIARARRVIIVVIFILAAVLTPSPDPASQVALGIPLYLLFEVSLWVGRILEKAR